jgi:hypothetical protein
MIHSGRNQVRYLRGELLGSGGWSKVYKVRRVGDGQVFAGKSCRTLHLMRKEAQILKSIDHVSAMHLVVAPNQKASSTADLR